MFPLDFKTRQWTGTVTLTIQAMTAAFRPKPDDTYKTPKNTSKEGAWTGGYEGYRTPSSGSHASSGSQPLDDQFKTPPPSRRGIGNWSCAGAIWNSQWWSFAYGVWNPTLTTLLHGLQGLPLCTTMDARPLTLEKLKGKVDLKWFGHAGFKI